VAQLSFNAANVAPQEPISPIPAGVYLAQVVESDVRPLKSGQGRALALTFQVLQGPCVNRRVFANLNIEHRSSAEAERIAQGQLSALCHAVGVINLQDTTQLHMRPVQIRVKVRKDDSGQYPDKNEVTGFEAAAPVAGQARPAAPMPASAPVAPPAAPAAPWARRTAGAQA
jgi:hypothetical protein